MANQFSNRVYGCAIIKSVNSNYNADFSGQPRKLPNGTVYATDKALKYSIRNYWEKVFKEEKVFFFKSLDDTLKPRTLDERYISLFGDFKRNISSDKFCFFQFDGEKIIGLIPNQPKAKNVKDILKDIEDENDELMAIKAELNKLSSKNIQVISIEDIKIEDIDEETFFYVSKNGEHKVIKGDKTTILNAVSAIIENMGGGINRPLTLKDLLSCLDVRLFGATYAGQVNISIHGTCQITHGINRFDENVIYSEQIMSPFRNSNEVSADKTMTTLGTQFKLEEGHYVHHFSINPKNIESDVKSVESEGLTNDDIAKLKEGLRKGATFYDSAAKSGTDNELLLWIQLKPTSKIVLPSLVELVDVNDNREIDLIKVNNLLAESHIASEIEIIELYYNKVTTKVINEPEGCKFIDL